MSGGPLSQPLLLAAVAATGGLASVLRWSLDVRWPARKDGGPLARQARGLWLANMLGSLLIGYASTLSSASWHAVLAVGGAGGLTTWSSWLVSAQSRWSASRGRPDADDERRAVVLQLGGQAFAGAASAGLGILLGQALGG